MAQRSSTAETVVHITPMCNSEYFLSRVRKGRGALCLQSPSGKWQQHLFEHVDEALAILQRFRGTHSVYATMACLRAGADTRDAKSVESLCGFFLDLDCHGKESDFASLDAASAALRGFCKETGLVRPSYIVDSGHGLHAHWRLTESIPTEQWLPVAKKLKKLTLAFGLKADPTVTADAARLLRVPNTLNLRDPSNPVEVQLLPVPGSEEYSLSEFEKAVDRGLAKAPHCLQPEPGHAPLVLASNYKAKERGIADTPENSALVQAMLGVIDPDLDYHTWRNLIWAVAASGLSSSYDLAHDWSERGQKWNPGEFERTWHSFDPDRKDGIGFGTLVHHSRKAGYGGLVPGEAAPLDNLTFGGPNKLTGDRAGGLVTRRAADIEPELVDWLVEGSIPLGMMVVIGGQPGMGKSQIALKLAAAVTTGEGFPDE